MQNWLFSKTILPKMNWSKTHTHLFHSLTLGDEHLHTDYSCCRVNESVLRFFTWKGAHDCVGEAFIRTERTGMQVCSSIKNVSHSVHVYVCM